MGSNARNILDVVVKLIRALECPVCYDYVISPIWQCNAGHIICDNCKSKITNCPTCRECFSSTRVRSLEQISDLMIFPCTNEGCEQMLPLNEIHSHEEQCTLSGARGYVNGDTKTMVVQYNILKHIENNIAPFFITKYNNKECETIKVCKDASTSTDCYVSNVWKSNKRLNEEVDTRHQSGFNSLLRSGVFRFNANVDFSNNTPKLFSYIKPTRPDLKKKISAITSSRNAKTVHRKISETSQLNYLNFPSSTSKNKECKTVQVHKYASTSYGYFISNIWKSNKRLNDEVDPCHQSGFNSLLSSGVFRFNANIDLSNDSSTLFSYKPTRQNLNKNISANTSSRNTTTAQQKISETSESNLFNFSSPTCARNNNSMSNVTIKPNTCVSEFPKMSTNTVPKSSVVSTSKANTMSASSISANSHIENISSASFKLCPQNKPVKYVLSNTNGQVSDTTSLCLNNNISSIKNLSNSKDVATHLISSINNSPSHGLSVGVTSENIAIEASNINDSATDQCGDVNEQDRRNMIFKFDKNITVSSFSTYESRTVTNRNISGTDNNYNRTYVTSNSTNRRKPFSLTKYINANKRIRDGNKTLPTKNQQKTCNKINPIHEIKSPSVPVSSSSLESMATNTILFRNLMISSEYTANFQKTKLYKTYKPNETVCIKFCKPNEIRPQEHFGIFQFQG